MACEFKLIDTCDYLFPCRWVNWRRWIFDALPILGHRFDVATVKPWVDSPNYDGATKVKDGFGEVINPI